MKTYNRKTRIWEEEKPVGDLKKPKLCKGGKPHNFLLALPEYVQVNGALTPYGIEEYYKIEAERLLTNMELDEKLRAWGIKVNRFYGGKDYKHYKCSVCGKKKFE